MRADELKKGDFLQVPRSMLYQDDEEGIEYFEVIQADGMPDEWMLFMLRNHEGRAVTFTAKKTEDVGLKVVTKLPDGYEGPNLVPTPSPRNGAVSTSTSH